MIWLWFWLWLWQVTDELHYKALRKSEALIQGSYAARIVYGVALDEQIRKDRPTLV